MDFADYRSVPMPTQAHWLAVFGNNTWSSQLEFDRVATPKTFFFCSSIFMSVNNVLLKAEDMVRDYMSRYDSSHDFLHVDRVRRSGMS